MRRALLILSLTGCASRYVDVEVRAEPPRRDAGRVALAPTVVLADVPGAVGEDAFRDGVFVGNLVFEGGYVTEQQELGLQNVSARINVKAEETYRGQVARVTDDLLEHALDRRGVDWTRLDALDPTVLPAPRRSNERGTYPDAGKDNTNLPRFLLEPTPLAPEALAALPSGHDTVLVPYVVQYYSHNAGWFVGQTWGCAGGARYRLWMVAYDASTGQPQGWTDITARYLHDRIFQPNSVQVEDFLMEVERALARSARRHLPR